MRSLDENKPEWLVDLEYLARQSAPIWQGVVKNHLDESGNLEILLQKGFAELADGGVVITTTGRRVLRSIDNKQLRETE